MQFPDGFAWGTATASYQIEGAVDEGGKSPSIWDTFAHTPGKIADGNVGDIADDHVHRYAEDIEIMRRLGVTHYRFSLSWPRLQPDARGELNPAGLDFYSRLVDGLLAAGIVPWVTLYHWDLPQSLEDAGGWPERDTAYRFADFAAAVHDRLADRIVNWTTLNEPWCAAFLGYASGTHAPGRTEPAASLRAAHHLLLGHGLAVRAMRDQQRGSTIGLTVNLYPVVPASDSEPDREAARRIDALGNRLFLDPPLRGSYPADLLEDVGPIAAIQDGDAAIIAAPLDFLGVNYYSRHIVRGGAENSGPTPWVGCSDVEFVKRDIPVTDMGWEIDPQGLYDVLARIHAEYPRIPLYVTENGAAFVDEVEADGAVHDPDRIAYLEQHFRIAHRAIEDGIDLRGYFVWTLMDNFEWSFGFSKRFGLVHVDYATQQRRLKDSAHWFAGVTARNGLP
ncbi:MAG TPA: GH1 family beta-glucosidase [Mycobacteriales bacterium]|nr:GH1 family beta-glucosidase [Mycobacteriales bacterium]